MIDQAKFDFVKRVYKDNYYNEGNDFRKQIEYIKAHPDPLCSDFDNKFLDECISHYHKGIKSFFANGAGLLGFSALCGYLSFDEPLFGVFSLIIGGIGLGGIIKGYSDYKNLSVFLKE